MADADDERGTETQKVHEGVMTWELLAVQTPLNSPLMVHGGKGQSWVSR